MLLALAAAAVIVPAAGAADGPVRRAAARQLPALERVVGAGVGSPALAQAQYDAARRLEASLPPSAGVSAGCRPLARDLQAYATGVLAATQGVDRLQSWRVAAGRRFADRALERVDRRRRTCRSTEPPRGVEQADAIASPRSGEAFFGDVREENHGEEARLYANGRLVETVRTAAAEVRLRLELPPGRYALELRFLRGGRNVHRSVARDVYLLPASAGPARPPRTTDRALNRRLAELAAGFPGHEAIYVQNLRTGRTAGWNADARFPAASTVKLGVAVAVLRRWRPHRRDLRLDPELRALAGWSSNLAANRLVSLLGGGSETRGAGIVSSVLRQLGATSSTYPQGYRVGTGVDAQPPLVSGRVTTARDLGTILRVVAAAAGGDSYAQRRSGLAAPSARYLLGLLLQGERSGNNIGLLAPALPRGTPIAQKNGWISSARHTAAIVYGHEGPMIVVVLTYREQLRRRDAVELGRLVVRTAL